MRPFAFPPAVLAEAAADRSRHPSPKAQRRMAVLWPTAAGVPRAEVVRLSGASRASVQRYRGTYRDGGRDAVRRLRYVVPTSALDTHAPTLDAHFRDHPPRTTADAQAAIARRIGVRRGLTRVRLFLKKLGLGCRKARGTPAEADPVAQKQFPDHELRPRLAAATAGTRRVLLADAAHFVRGAFLGYLWCLARWVVPTGRGRPRYTVAGALDAVTHEPIRETNVGVVDPVTAGRLLRRIRERYPTGPITVAWGNARYRHTALVRSRAACHRIALLYPPPYPPDRNLIERVWKFVKADALANRRRADFAAVRTAIDGTRDPLHTTRRDRMRSLLAPNFQVLEPASVPAA